MRFLTLLSLFLFFVGTRLSAFSSLPVQADCDTILTQKGKTLIVRIVSQDKERVRYQYCGDSSSAVIRFITTKNIKEIRRGKKTDIQPEPKPAPDPATVAAPSGTTSENISTDIPADAVKVDPKIETKRAYRLSKIAAIFSFGTPFWFLFSFAFSFWLFLFFLPFLILGMVYSIKAVRATRRRPELSKPYRLSLASLILSLIMGGLVAVYILIVFIVLLLILLSF
jgi:hypothetical protein